MCTNTLYYTFSTIPQILAATTAILAAFIHFRLLSIKELLIGDGISALDRYKSKEDGYSLEEDYASRLRDGINRKSIAEIKEVLKILCEKEKGLGRNKNTNPTGFHYLYEDRFCPTESKYRKLILYSLIIIAIKIFTIIFATICLTQVDSILFSDCNWLLLYMNQGLLILSLLLTLFLVIMSFSFNTPYEDLKKRDKIIERNRNSK